jgi:DNA-binding transcriptional LysR family regulator
MRPHNRALRLTLRAGDTAEVVQLRPVVQANDNVFVRDATLSGAALGVLIAEIAAADVAAGRLVPVLDAWSPVERGAIFLLHENTPRLPAKVRAFREHARRALGGV